MSTAVIDETPTEAIATVPAAEPQGEPTVTATKSPGLFSGPATGSWYVLEGSYKKLARGLKPVFFRRRPSLEDSAALAQAISRATPHISQEGAARSGKVIPRYVENGVQVVIEDRRYEISLLRDGGETVLAISYLAR